MRSRWAGLAPAVLLALVSNVRAANPPVTVFVDDAANRRAISPLIYGVHFADAPTLRDLNATVNRYGGNSAGRYNWLQNIDNRGGDFYFESIPYVDVPGELGDTFIQTSKDGGAEPFLTMPMVGSVAQTNAQRDTRYSFSINTCGPQTDSDANLPDAGNGCVAGPDTYPCGTGVPMRTPPPGCDPLNASTPADHVFQQGWMQHVKDTWGPASAGGLKFWGFDNEPTLWHNVYWDVHPLPADMDEMRTKMIDYGERIKTVDATAQILGLEEWGWDGFFYSGKDQQLIADGTCGGSNCPDRVAHGNMDYVPYLLSQMKAHRTGGGQRVLDWLSLHFYPQGGEYQADSDPAQDTTCHDTDPTGNRLRLRNRSTRGLWDPAYVNESWINDVVRLIPRMKEWASTFYPSGPGDPTLKVGLTEYNWGAECDINGGTAQADLLGIFGREGLDMASRWMVPPAGTPAYNAIKMYRNYDGAKSTFGDTSVSAIVPQPDELAAFAAQRSGDGSLTVMVINKDLTNATPTTVNLANFVPAATAEAWQLKADNVITRIADIAVVGNSFTATLPKTSITLFVVHPGVLLPSLSIDDVTLSEGNAGATTATFTVTLSEASLQTVTVGYATADGTATVVDGDYVAASGTLTFSPGDTAKTVVVTVNGDTKVEPGETFFVNLASPFNATIVDGQGKGTIGNDDALPSLSINDAVVTEGQAGSVNAMFTVTLSAASLDTVAIKYATADGTAMVANGDYLPASGTLVLAPGTTTATVGVTVKGDTRAEPSETFFVDLTNPTNATLADGRGQGTIVNDDGRRPLCVPIVSVPYTIGAQGNYCLVQNLSTSVASGNAITIRSDFVTLDLKGFKIGGGAAGAGTHTNGVYALNRKNIAVKNGNIRGFFRAVFLEDDSGAFTASQGHLVVGVRADENTYAGIDVQGRGNVIRGNQVVATGGTTVFGADAEAYGIRTQGPGVRILNNDVTDTNPAGAASAFAISLESAPGAVVEKNRLANSAANSSYGMRAASGQDVLAIGNRVSGTAFGLIFEASTGKYRDNLTTGVATPYTGGTDAGNNQ